MAGVPTAPLAICAPVEFEPQPARPVREHPAAVRQGGDVVVKGAFEILGSAVERAVRVEALEGGADGPVGIEVRVGRRAPKDEEIAIGEQDRLGQAVRIVTRQVEEGRVRDALVEIEIANAIEGILGHWPALPNVGVTLSSTA